MRGRIAGAETHCHGIRNPESSDSFPYQMIKNAIILLKESQHLSFGIFTHFCQAVVMLVLTLITAEFLILSTITDTVATFQATRQMSFPFLVVIHKLHYLSINRQMLLLHCINQSVYNILYAFTWKYFSFFSITRVYKDLFYRHKKRFLRLLKKEKFKKRKNQHRTKEKQQKKAD